MSSASFKANVVDKTLKYLNDESTKDRVRKHNGQLFLLDPEIIHKTNAIVGVTGVNSDKVLNDLKSWLLNKQASFKAQDLPRFSEIESFTKSHSISNYYIISNYNVVANELYKKWKFILGTEHGVSYEEQKKIASSGIKGGKGKDSGVNVGHGNYGIAVAGIRVLGAVSALEKAIENEPQSVRDRVRSELIDKITKSAFDKGLTKVTVQQNRTVEFTHDRVLDSSGNIRDDYIVILALEDAYENQKFGRDVEQTFIESVRKMINETDFANMEGSKSLKDGMESVILNNLVKVKGFKSSKPTKSKETSKHRVKTLQKIKKEIYVGKMKAPTVSRTNSERQTRTGPTINLVALINAKLPEEIRKRMTYPRLQWRTGRFAGSVRALSAEATRNGGVTVGYTYQKNPYELFEPGRSSLATPARDPKQLIDLSIRAIAQQYVQGRFYTRRM